MTKITKTKLKNGLTVILQENHNAPVVSMNLLVKVGSAHESDKEAGLSHVMEHMLFKGTQKRGLGVISKEVEALGGMINAYTWLEETVYYINMASRFYEKGLDILADAAINSVFDAEELAKETEVVLEEVSRGEDNPGRNVGEILFTEAFKKHPYRRPVIGTRKTIQSFTREQILGFYKKWYVAKSMVLIVVGDFETKKILPQIKKLYGPLSSKQPPARKVVQEPKQTSIRSTIQTMKIEGNYFDLGFHIPGLVHKDVAGLDVLACILGGGDSSRLDQIVKEKKGLATSIYAAAFTPRDPCLFFIGGHLPEGSVYKAFEAIGKEVQRFCVEPVSLQELDRTKFNLRSSAIYEKETVEGVAKKFNFFEGHTGNHLFEDSYYEELEKVTQESIIALAKKYLTPQNLTAAICVPERSKGKVTKAGMEKALKKGFSQTRTASKKEKITHERLKNGMQLIFRENLSIPVVSIQAMALGGIRYENKKNNGINNLLTSVWTKQTVTRTNLEIAEQSDAISGSFGASCGRNSVGLRGTFLSSKLAEGVQLFTELMLHPTFPEDEVAREKVRILDQIKSQEDSLATVAFRKFFAALYPTHPYGLSVLGTKQSLKGLKSKHLQDYYKKLMAPKNWVISVSGDFNRDELRERLKEKLGSLSSKESLFKSPVKPARPKEVLSITTRKDKKQAHIAYGFLGSEFKNKDRFALEVLSSILSGMGGRLFMELRDKRGLAYTVTSQVSEGVDPGYFAVYMGTDPSKLDQALPGIKHELKEISTQLVTNEEINRTKNCLIGNYEVDLQMNSSVAGLLASDVLFGLGLNEWTNYAKNIRAVTRQDVLRVAKKYITMDKAVLSVVKP